MDTVNEEQVQLLVQALDPARAAAVCIAQRVSALVMPLTLDERAALVDAVTPLVRDALHGTADSSNS